MSSPSPPNPYWKGPTPVSNSNSSEEHSNSNVSLIVGVVVGVGLFLVFVLMLGAFFIKKKKKKKKPHDPMQYYADSGPQDNGYYSSTVQSKWLDGSHPPTPGGGWQQHAPQATIDDNEVITAHSGPRGAVLPPPSPLMALGYNDSTFTYEELAHATNGFSEANLLGQGGFGYVHKGVLPNGKEIAVKQLKAGSGQGEREFQAEVDTISRVHHRHLVSLIGYCISGAQRILIYEFVPNNNLEYHLHGEGIPPLDWCTRIKIALGAAKGIAFLHEDCHPRIIHRDIKAANILLDDKFEAMVADFGLAKLSPDNFTHISTRVMGTFGYLAPEYASSGKLTEKSDVFSYGVMLLELITGQRPVESEHTSSDDGLVDWARQIMPRAMVNGNYNELIDPRLQNKYDAVELVRMVVCAAACIRHSAKQRPKMSQIVRALEGDLMLDELNEGVKPSNSMVFSSSSDYESSSNNSNANFFKKHATSSPDHSGEYSCSLDENVRHPSMSSSDGVVVSGELNAVLNHTNRPQKQV